MEDEVSAHFLDHFKLFQHRQNMYLVSDVVADGLVSIAHVRITCRLEIISHLDQMDAEQICWWCLLYLFLEYMWTPEPGAGI